MSGYFKLLLEIGTRCWKTTKQPILSGGGKHYRQERRHSEAISRRGIWLFYLISMSFKFFCIWFLLHLISITFGFYYICFYHIWFLCHLISIIFYFYYIWFPWHLIFVTFGFYYICYLSHLISLTFDFYYIQFLLHLISGMCAVKVVDYLVWFFNSLFNDWIGQPDYWSAILALHLTPNYNWPKR